MADVTVLEAQARTRAGKGVARRLRVAGRVPGVIYGMKDAPLNIDFTEHDLMMMLKKGGFFTNVQTIKVDGKAHKVLPRDVQHHPVNGRALHVDFLRYDAKSKIHVNVSVHLIDEDKSPGIKIGGVVSLGRPEIELICRADSIPDFIEVSLAGLEIGDSVHISSVTLPEGVEPAIHDRDFTIASVVSTRTSKSEDEEVEEGEGVEGEEGAEGEAAESAEGGDADESKSE